jgi:hypothetical protein
LHTCKNSGSPFAKVKYVAARDIKIEGDLKSALLFASTRTALTISNHFKKKKKKKGGGGGL